MSTKKIKRSGKRIRDRGNSDCQIDDVYDDDDDFKVDDRVVRKFEVTSILKP